MGSPALTLVADRLNNLTSMLLSFVLNMLLFTGQPKRHLLTTGWSVFVSAKRLVAGDSVLFIWFVPLFQSTTYEKVSNE
jgi:hypothetical protein